MAGDTFMHLRQTGNTYRAYGPFTKNKEGIQKLKKTGDFRFNQSKQEKAWFQHDMVYATYIVLPRRKFFLQSIMCQSIWTSWKFKVRWISTWTCSNNLQYAWQKKSKDATQTETRTYDAVSREISNNQQLAKVLHKPITRKFKKPKLCLFFLDKIQCIDFAYMWLISKYNNGIWFPLSLINIKVNVIGLFCCKIKRTMQLQMHFKILEESSREPTKVE